MIAPLPLIIELAVFVAASAIVYLVARAVVAAVGVARDGRLAVRTRWDFTDWYVGLWFHRQTSPPLIGPAGVVRFTTTVVTVAPLPTLTLAVAVSGKPRPAAGLTGLVSAGGVPCQCQACQQAAATAAAKGAAGTN